MVGSPAAAQVPGDELPGIGRIRNEFLTATFTDIKQVLSDWQEHHRKGDVKRLARMFTEDGLFSPASGWYVQGRSAVADTFAARLGKMRNYHTSLIDFTASGGLAYYLGRMSYSLGEGAGSDVMGTFVMVLYQEGRSWRVRSYVERPGPS